MPNNSLRTDGQTDMTKLRVFAILQTRLKTINIQLTYENSVRNKGKLHPITVHDSPEGE